MDRLHNFRKFYNHTIYPELMRMERKRRRLIRLLFFSVFLLIGIILFEIYINVWLVTLLMIIPIGLYVTFLFFEVQKFKETFKPRIVNLILDFIDDRLLYDNSFTYDSKKKIAKSIFLVSRLFVTKAPIYKGEDFIKGRIGDLDFEMSELTVQEYSRVGTRIDEVFDGVFMHATLPQPVKGAIIVWPRPYRSFLTHTIKNFTKTGARNVDKMMIPSFQANFMTYASPKSDIDGCLPGDMQESIVNYHLKSEKDVFLSFSGKDVYVGVTHDKDLLEPYIFRSNVTFELIREFFEDIQVLLNVLEVFDLHH